MSKPKEIRLVITKTANGYSVINHTENVASICSDDDVGRKALIQALVDQLLNAEVQGGRGYK